MTLKNVVLPAPLGPISAVIEPSATSSVAPSTAKRPPKCLTTSSVSRIGAPLDAPVARAEGAVASFTEHHLLALAEHSLRPERHQQDQDQPNQDEADRLLVLDVEKARRLVDDREEDGSRCDAPIVGQATGDQRSKAEKGDRRRELARDDESQAEREEQARNRAERRGDRERLQLVGEGVL